MRRRGYARDDWLRASLRFVLRQLMEGSVWPVLVCPCSLWLWLVFSVCVCFSLVKPFSLFCRNHHCHSLYSTEHISRNGIDSLSQRKLLFCTDSVINREQVHTQRIRLQVLHSIMEFFNQYFWRLKNIISTTVGLPGVGLLTLYIPPVNLIECTCTRMMYSNIDLRRYSDETEGKFLVTSHFTLKDRGRIT